MNYTDKDTITHEVDIKEIDTTIETTGLEQVLAKHDFANIATEMINAMHQKKQKRDIWSKSKWKHIADLENDDVGKVGEQIINELCKLASMPSEIDGVKTKKIGGGNGDGIINNKTVEIKTARLGSSGSTFQHELGEVPWHSDFMLFLDIAPEKMYITLFPNFSEEFYKTSGCNSNIKCGPYFESKSITWRKQKGAFKLDTTVDINKKNKYTFTIDTNATDLIKFRDFVNSIITL